MGRRRIHRLVYPMLGFTADNGVMFDLDHYKFETVEKIAENFLEQHKLKGYLIIETSKNCYSIIFNKYLKWKDVLTIMGKLYFYLGGRKTAHGRHYGEWLILQIIKQASTIRVSPKGNKPKPKLIKIKGKTDGLIKDYLELYNLKW